MKNKKMSRITRKECYEMLDEIRIILNDEPLDYGACYWKIEEVIYRFEKMHIKRGQNHLFKR